jgi:glutamate-1-semialdehyde 2,1-aminomutase
MATLGIADTQGVPKAFADTTLALPYNSVEALAAAFASYGDQIAAVILEPVVGNMGVVRPSQDFLQALRKLTSHYGALLIFDEVMTGFRLALGGAQELFGMRPDLTTLGKIIGGGLPLAAYGGRRDIMSKVAPAGPVYQAGTLSGNPVAVAAGLAMVRHLKAHPEVYARLEASSAKLASAAPAGTTVNRAGSMITFFFTGGGAPVTDWETAKVADTKAFGRMFHHLLDRGVYFPPSQFEAAFVSAAHTDADIESTCAALRDFSN